MQPFKPRLQSRNNGIVRMFPMYDWLLWKIKKLSGGQLYRQYQAARCTLELLKSVCTLILLHKV